MTNMEKVTQISPENIARMLAGEWAEVQVSDTSTPNEDYQILVAVADAVTANGDTLPVDLVKLLSVTVRAWDDGSSEEDECDHGDVYAAVAESLWKGADYGHGDYRVEVSWTATDYAGEEIASGDFKFIQETKEPECSEADGHDWTSEGEGGCDENPGVWSTGGTAMVFYAHCRNCRMRRVRHTTGSQRNPGECDTTRYEEGAISPA